MSGRSSRTQVELAADTSMERLVASQLSRLLVLVPPWLLAVAAVISAAVFHAAWGGNAAAAAGIGAAGAALTALTWRVAHQRGSLGRSHAAGTSAAVAAWMTAATLHGVTGPVLSYLAAVGGIALALSWNIRAVIRSSRGHHDSADDHLSRAFEAIGEQAGLGKARLEVRKRSARVIEGAIALEPGAHIADDAVKRAGRIESGLRFPPGSVSIAPDPDRADRATVRISDPRAMRRPQPWPGPSHPGESAALPLVPGIWQDSEPVQYVITGHHLQVNGMTGAGKSIGAAWCLLAELITRRDCAVLAADVTKGTQTLGALAPALHRFEVSKDGARSMLDAVHAAIRPRTDHLAGRGLQRWEEGCGLTYLVVWLEECPDIIDALGDAGRDRWLSAMKAARSAGITFVLSLQRSDWTQMPTLARGQMAKMCFGLASASDAAFGLSEVQSERGARPELWGSRQPGMCYLDAPGIPDERVAMAMRTWYFGSDDTLMAGHAARWPASDRPLDDLTVSLLGGTAPAPPADSPDETGEASGAELVRQIAPVEDESDAAEPGDITVPDDDFGRWQFGPQAPAVKADPAAARQALAALVESWRQHGSRSFAIADLAEFRASCGLSRPWLYKALAELASAGIIERDDTTGKWALPETRTR